MKNWLHKLRNLFEHKAVVLMYHRIAAPASDVWDLTVAPAIFEQHLKLLQKSHKVIPLQELVASVNRQSIQKNTVAITFDDGYADNYLLAKPLLEKYKLPATFFISSGHLDQVKEFWWDELEHLLLFSRRLPQRFAANVADSHFEFDLGEEALLTSELQQRHGYWKAGELSPVSLRTDLYLKLYFLLKPLPYQQQQQLLHLLKDWAGISANARPAYRSMTLTELQELSRSSLLDIGIHTETHPSLASHPLLVQRQEILNNKKYLERVMGEEINILAYPYGDHNSDTVGLAADLGLAAAFTTKASPIRNNSHKYRLGRYQVQNWSGPEFQRKLGNWFNTTK